MMTGGAVGTFVGAWAYGLVGGYGWRYVFFIGVVPAILLAIIRRRMLEPERFADVHERRRAVAAGLRSGADDREFMRFVPLQLFTREHRYNTMVGVLFGLGSLLAIWTTNIWLPTILSLMVQKSGAADATAAVPFVSHGIMLWSLGGICGYIAFGFIADHRRPSADRDLLQRRHDRRRAHPLSGAARLRAVVPGRAADLRLLRVRRILGLRGLPARAVPDPHPLDRGRVLHRQRPHHHQLRPARRRACWSAPSAAASTG